MYNQGEYTGAVPGFFIRSAVEIHRTRQMIDRNGILAKQIYRCQNQQEQQEPKRDYAFMGVQKF